jgi:tetratricopeptide (TPR) repeat protein
MTRNALFQQADAGANDRDYARAARMLDGPDSKKYYGDKDQVLRYLDTGMLYQLGGQPDQSIKRLEEADRLIDENYTKSVSNAVASFVLNDYQLEYFGEAYEDIYVNVFKAIDYIQLGRYEDAGVEIRRVNTKLNLLEDKYGRFADSLNASPTARGAVKPGRTEFHNSALARYLSALLYRAENRPDDAALDLRNLREAFATQPNLFNFAVPKLDEAPQAPGTVRLSVLAFTGRSPLKRANNLRINTLQNLIVISQQTEDAAGNLEFTNMAPLAFPGVEQGYNFKAELPEMVLRPSRVTKIRVLVDGVPAGELSLIEKLDTIAHETFALSQTPIFFKTVIRTVTKGILTKKAKDAALQAASSAGSLGTALAFAGGLAADLAVDASEQADLRIARYFPGRASVGEFDVAPGTHTVSVEYFGPRGELLYRDPGVAKPYQAGGLNLFASFDLE